jgi:signal transduction histidine kinase
MTAPAQALNGGENPRPIDPTVLWFGRIFLARRPVPAEEADIVAALSALRRRWLWLLAAYLLFVAVTVLPGVLRDRSPGYTAAAILLPHAALYLLAVIAAYCWVGYRVNLLTYRRFVTDMHRSRRRRIWVQSMLIWALAGAVVGYFGASVGDGVWPAVDQWVRDSFSTPVLLVLFLILIAAVPELIAQLRLRESELAHRMAQAEAAGEKLARQTVEAELRLLQAQVEPHFLYNTLANVRYLVSSSSPEAPRMIDALIDYLRTSVPDMRAPTVALGREIDHATHYLELMKMRMGDRLHFSVEVLDALREIVIPPLIVLTLVENAIKHGIAPSVEGGAVHIRVAEDSPGDAHSRVRIDVADTGVGVVEPLGVLDRKAALEAIARDDNAGRERQAAQAGLASIRGRLALTYGGQAGFTLEANTPRGVIGRVTLPRTLPATSAAGKVRVLYAKDDEELRRIARWAASDANPQPLTPEAP